MTLDLYWILLGYPLVFLFGWLASRLDLRQLRLENRLAPKAYFKGLNHLLNEQQDQAIDAFIEAVQHDPETIDLHFALGNLFRRRGDFDRAVRVHEHLLARGDVSQADRERAKYALAQDFLQAGLMDRAESAFEQLAQGGQYANSAKLTLLSLVERTRDWRKAAQLAQQLHASELGDFKPRLAHYLCEQASEQTDAGAAKALLVQALELDSSSGRARIDSANWWVSQGDASQAYSSLLPLMEQVHPVAPLAAQQFAQLAIESGQVANATALLNTVYENTASTDVLHARLLLQQSAPLDGVKNAAASTQAMMFAHLNQSPSMRVAYQWLQNFAQPELPSPVMNALEKQVKPMQNYRCAACGFETGQHFWHCPGCQSWDSYPALRVEELG